jgi:L-alanine-DL-glutamate epimerase-like enolase superfamily enzyme
MEQPASLSHASAGASDGLGRIATIDTWRWVEQPNCLWVEITTDTGITGLGETFYNATAVEAIIHDMVAPLLLGAPAAHLNEHWRNLYACANFYGHAGAEMRAFSAVDIALWDALGQALGQPVHALLGGAMRDRVRLYATCADAGDYPDQTRWLQDPAGLAQEIADQGFTGMKIWPWDRFAPQIKGRFVTGAAGWSAMGPPGHYISAPQIGEGVRALATIREAVGERLEIFLEGHSRWDLNCALKIAHAVEEFGIGWMEDFLQPDNADDLAQLAAGTSVPQSVSERLITRFPFRSVLQAGAARVAMLDVAWVGGITEAVKVCDLADTFHLPFAPHDCTGPVTVLVNLHLAAAKPNFMIAEVVRGFIEGYYNDVLDMPIVIENGAALVPTRPGIGAALSPEFRSRPTVVTRRSRL